MGKNVVYRQYLKDTDGTEWNSKSMTTATGTYTSDKIEQSFTSGYTSLLVLTSAGSLAITFQMSDDGTNWYTPVNTSGTSQGTIYSTLTANAWIVFTPQIGQYIRFVFVLTSANSTVSAIFRQQVPVTSRM